MVGWLMVQVSFRVFNVKDCMMILIIIALNVVLTDSFICVQKSRPDVDWDDIASQNLYPPFAS